MDRYLTIDDLDDKQKVTILKNFHRYCEGEINLTQLGKMANISKIDTHWVMGSINNLPDGNPYVK